MDNRAIGIFDSGLGGLTCVKKVMEIMPNENIIYFGDTGRVPYGTKGKETLLKYVRQNINFLESFDIKLIIIACGTASSAALPHIQSEINTEIIGVLNPACTAAIKATQNNKIGVIGTSGTVKSGKYVETIKNIDHDIEVFQKACPMFVPIVENGYTKTQISEIIAKEYLEDIKNSGVDTLIMGCTHYPLLREEIAKVMGENVTLIDAGREAAVFAKELLSQKDALSDRPSGKTEYYVSDTVDGFSELGSLFLERHIEGDVFKIDIERY